jgi:ATP-dependent RNA helicase DDX52/ROK1
MEDLFNILSSSARLDKSRRAKKRERVEDRASSWPTLTAPTPVSKASADSASAPPTETSRDRTGKRDTSDEKLAQVHREQVAAFRRCLNIRLGPQNKDDSDIPDPISSFGEIATPNWWRSASDSHDKLNNSLPAAAAIRCHEDKTFGAIQRPLLRNIESGRWKEPTPIQMQGIPALLHGRRDVIASAPTGSGKSGAFLIPALFLGSAPHDVFYYTKQKQLVGKSANRPETKMGKHHPFKLNLRGEIRTLVLAPSLELAAQLHREVERLGQGKPGGVSAVLLSKSNAAQVIAGHAGGNQGLDCLVSTPLRLVDSIEKGLKLTTVRMVVLDEADRLLDATDTGKRTLSTRSGARRVAQPDDSDESDQDVMEELDGTEYEATSGSGQSQTFLAQMDVILAQIPESAIRALFSATVTPQVRLLAESILRNPIDMTIAASGSPGGANPDIEQELMFVGREEGKLLAIRQLAARGQLRPPVLIFLQSQERAQALFGELLYDGLHVDVIHAGRSKAAREKAVRSFRKGDTWVLIGTDLVARGVDFRAVNMVINYDLPASGVTYIHRIGRAGRAGRKGKDWPADTARGREAVVGH